ncbi:MAG: unnamed protein product [uncultured Paraburkholderia sp.]|nr:MAG: unnamed protein product [uncultured Paraburkholderia sp.]
MHERNRATLVVDRILDRFAHEAFGAFTRHGLLMPIPDDSGKRIFLMPISSVRNLMIFFACSDSAGHSISA